MERGSGGSDWILTLTAECTRKNSFCPKKFNPARAGKISDGLEFQRGGGTSPTAQALRVAGGGHVSYFCVHSLLSGCGACVVFFGQMPSAYSIKSMGRRATSWWHPPRPPPQAVSPLAEDNVPLVCVMLSSPELRWSPLLNFADSSPGGWIVLKY